MVESQVAWSVAHTQQDRQNFLVLARHFGIDRPSWISGSQTPRNVDIVSAFPQVTALPLRAEALRSAVGYRWAHGGPEAPWGTTVRNVVDRPVTLASPAPACPSRAPSRHALRVRSTDLAMSDPALYARPKKRSVRWRRQRLGHHGDQLVLDSGDDLVLEWEQRGLGWRRAVLDAVIDRVEVAPSANGIGRNVANRCPIRWRTDQRRDPAEDDGILECRWQALASTRLARADSDRIVEHDHRGATVPA